MILLTGEYPTFTYRNGRSGHTAKQKGFHRSYPTGRAVAEGFAIFRPENMLLLIRNR